MQHAHDGDLAGVDLNLLVALDALLGERHVTRAARRLGLTQPAASHALARLRELFGDPLLVRAAGGGLQPTPRGLELGPAVHRALGELAGVLRAPAPFDPATARRTFRLGTGDYAELILLPRLVARVRAAAPGVDLFMVPEVEVEALARGEVDVVLSPPRPEWGAGYFQRALFGDDFTCVVRRQHPAATRRLTLARFCELDHLLISPRGSAGGIVDDALAKLGRSRRIAVTVPHFLVAPHVVAATDLVLTLAARVADRFARPLGLAALPPPLELPGFTIHAAWHERTHADAGHRWFRDQIAAVAGQLHAA